jgi:hypothetical protein
MKRSGWIGWLLASLLLLQNAATGLAAPAGGNPLEGHLLHDSTGTFYLYHGGLKFAVQVADLGDQVMEAIPTASSTQWETLFGTLPSGPGSGPAGRLEPAPPGQPVPFPGYS